MIYIIIGIVIYIVGAVVSWGFIDGSSDGKPVKTLPAFIWSAFWPISWLYCLGSAIGSIAREQMKRDEKL